ncbi:MAG TPA: hypothetical protein VGR22_08545 [Thermomicrobiales bacterium]|nr:hypothetical protein [Thermomicrobiales bacterium]
MRPIAWEYHLEPAAVLDADRLNALGREAWELATLVPSTEQAIFKRPALDYRERITLEQRAQVEQGRQEGER